MKAGPSALAPQAARGLVADAVGLAARLPDILISARRIAHSLLHGLHGRRRAGPGEDFWQYRHFDSGESAGAIDWRRSARDEHLYVREREWQSAHTVWIWTDLSPSMAVSSPLAAVTKRERALLLAFTLAEMLVHSGERVGFLGLTRPSASRFLLDRVAQELAARDPLPMDSLPPALEISRSSELVVIGDLLAPPADMAARLAAIGGQPHLIEVLDPAEEVFPFDGRINFLDPESGMKFDAGRAESYRTGYGIRLAAHREELRDLIRRSGGDVLRHRTDRNAGEALLALFARLGAGFGSVSVGRG